MLQHSLGFFFSFMVAKHPPGYLLSLSFLSSHLQMRWQATPAPTETIKVNNNSMTITSSRCRVSVGQHQNYSILTLTIPPLFGNYFSYTSTYFPAAVIYTPDLSLYILPLPTVIGPSTTVNTSFLPTVPQMA